MLYLATTFEPQFTRFHREHDSSGSVFVALMGDSRRMFANHFFAEADAYFHSGFYPTIFDTPAPEEPGHLTETQEEHDKEDHTHEETFLGKPSDWIDRWTPFLSHRPHPSEQRPRARNPSLARTLRRDGSQAH